MKQITSTTSTNKRLSQNMENNKSKITSLNTSQNLIQDKNNTSSFLNKTKDKEKHFGLKSSQSDNINHNKSTTIEDNKVKDIPKLKEVQNDDINNIEEEEPQQTSVIPSIYERLHNVKCIIFRKEKN